MTARKPSRKVFLNPHVLFSRLKAFWPLLLWGLAVAAALHIYLNGGKFGGMAGTVITSQDNAAPLEAGRLTRIFVKVGDTVTPNMPLAQMDTSLLVAEKAVYEAEAKALQGELEAVTAEVEHMEKLVSQRLASEQDLLPLRLEQKTLQSTIAAAETDRQIALLNMRIEQCTLRAQADGIVSRIYHSAGNVIQSGDPILSSVVKEPPQIVGFLSEYNARDVYPGMDAYLTPVSGYGAVVRAKVSSLTPEVFTLPSRINPNPAREYRGRRVILEPESGTDLLPGEEVQINFQRPWTFQIFANYFRKASVE